MNFKSIFVDNENIPRSGWRFAAFFILFFILAVILGGAGQYVLYSTHIPFNGAKVIFITVNALASLIPALLAGWLCGKFLEGLPFRALGVWFSRLWFSHLTYGCLAGAGTLAIAVIVAAAFGGLRFSFNSDAGSSAILSSLAISLAVFAVAAAFEEALFRGYILQTFNRSGLGWLAVVLTSTFFGILHLQNPSAGAISTINTVLAGIWFAVAYLKTRDLWFVWGMHLTWNWVQGSIFGIEVSGLTEISISPLLKEIDKGPTWLTGDTYGIEGGIGCTIAIAVSIAVIYFLPFIRPSEEMLVLTSPKARSTDDFEKRLDL